MNAADFINSVLGLDDFASYDQSVFEKYQEIAKSEIVEKLNRLFSSIIFIQILIDWGAKAAYKFHGYREITIRLKSGREWKVRSPVFLKAKSKSRKGRPPKRKKGVLRHLGLELLDINKQSQSCINRNMCFNGCVVSLIRSCSQCIERNRD